MEKSLDKTSQDTFSVQTVIYYIKTLNIKQKVTPRTENYFYYSVENLIAEFHKENYSKIGTNSKYHERMRKEVKPKYSNPRGIRISLSIVESYINLVFDEIKKNTEEFIDLLTVPLSRDPLFILGQIQHESVDYFSSIEQIITQPILPIEFYLSLEHKKDVDSIDIVPSGKEHKALLREWSNIHDKCIFDAINDALDFYRPYALRGPPLPWSSKLRELTYKNGSVDEVNEVLLGIKEKVLSWAAIKAGSLAVPEVITNKIKEDNLDEIIDMDVIILISVGRKP